MIKIGAGWDKVNERGEYISFSFEKSADSLHIELGKTSMVAFRNGEKSEEKQPDWLLFLGEKGERA